MELLALQALVPLLPQTTEPLHLLNTALPLQTLIAIHPPTLTEPPRPRTTVHLLQQATGALLLAAGALPLTMELQVAVTEVVAMMTEAR